MQHIWLFLRGVVAILLLIAFDSGFPFSLALRERILLWTWTMPRCPLWALRSSSDLR